MVKSSSYFHFSKGRGSEKNSYNSYGDQKFHNKGDKIRLECKLGYVNTVGKRQMQAECKCENGVCAWTKRNPDWGCTAEEGVRIFILTYMTYMTLAYIGRRTP